MSFRGEAGGVICRKKMSDSIQRAQQLMGTVATLSRQLGPEGEKAPSPPSSLPQLAAGKPLKQPTNPSPSRGASPECRSPKGGIGAIVSSMRNMSLGIAGRSDSVTVHPSNYLAIRDRLQESERVTLAALHAMPLREKAVLPTLGAPSGPLPPIVTAG